MMNDTGYLILFSANLTFIVTNLYGWLLKWFYRPQAYSEHFEELFPAQRSVGVIYVMQVCELPYLFHVGDGDALFYVNAFSLLFFSLQMYFMCEGYFFPRSRRPLREYWVIIPAAIVLLPLLLQTVEVISLPEGWQFWGHIVVSVLFLSYFLRNIRMALRIERAARRANEERYADSDDFPVRFANIIKWVPTLIIILLAINFYAENPWVKFARDILFIGASTWFCILTLNPWRNHVVHSNITNQCECSNSSERSDASSHLLSDERYKELSGKLDRLLAEERIFTEQHITVDTLIARLGTNSKYLAEVIRRSGYGSFYDMICQHRVRHAIGLIHQHPEAMMADIAADCGFSSPASMAKAFKSQGKESPSSYRRSFL